MEYSSIYQLLPAGTPDTFVKSFLPLWSRDIDISMAWNSDDNCLYKICFRRTQSTSDTIVFEKIDLYGNTITPIVLSGDSFENSFSMTYRGSGVFLIHANRPGFGTSLFTLTTTGVGTALSLVDMESDGMCCIGGTLYILNYDGSNKIHSYDADTGVANVDEYTNPIVWTLTPATEDFALGSENYGLVDISDESNVMFESLMNLSTFDDEVEESVTRQHRCQINLTNSSVSSVQSFGNLRYNEFCGSNNGNLAISDSDHLHDYEAEIDLQETSLYNISESPQFLIRFDNTDIIMDGAVAWNRDDGYIYSIFAHTVTQDNVDATLRFVRYKANTEDPDLETITLSGDVYVPGEIITTTHYINDGGDDMYDQGNVIMTNNGVVAYTHTTSPNDNTGEFFEEIADGAVADGSSRFGSGSEYFTNMYSKMFVMCASSVDITKFAIEGELGADGSGQVTGGEYSMMVNGHVYTYYTKFVYDSGDPAVCHVIIVSGDYTGITHTFSLNTNNDKDVLTGVGARDRLYYLLFSQNESSSPPDMEDVSSMVEAFLEIVDPTADMTAALAALNTSITDVTSLIVDPFIFTDNSEGPTDVEINTVEGIQEPSAMTYVGRTSGNPDSGYFMAFDNENSLVFKITTGGVVTLLGATNAHTDGAVYYKGAVYSVGSEPFLAIIDPKTGKTINEFEDYKFSHMLTIYGELLFPEKALVQNGELCVITYLGDDEEHEITAGDHLISVNRHNGECLPVRRLNNDDLDYLDVFGVGTNPPDTSDWFVSRETDFSIEINGTPPSEGELQVQYFEENFYHIKPKTSGWTTANFTIETSEDNSSIVVDLNPSDVESLTIRVRYVGDESTPASAWRYTFWD